MGAVGVLLAALGPWVMPLFVGRGDPQAADVVRLGVVLLWIAAGYQLFDGLQLGSGFALRGAGDVRVPALIFLGLAWGVFVPLAHMLSFAPGEGWFDVLPQFGYGAVGRLGRAARVRDAARRRACTCAGARQAGRGSGSRAACLAPTPSGPRSRTAAPSSGARAAGRRSASAPATR